MSGTLAFLLVGLLPEEQLLTWGWRVSFLVGFALIGVALYVRLRIAESPVFRRIEDTQQVVRQPIQDALMQYPRNFLIGIGAHICDTALAYFYTTFTISYVTTQLGLPSSTALTGIIMYGIVVILLQPVYGALSDRIGRRPINIFSVVFTAAFAFAYFLLLNTGVPVLIWLALLVATTLGWAPMIAVQGAFYAELFGARPLHGVCSLAGVGSGLGWQHEPGDRRLASGSGRCAVVGRRVHGLARVHLLRRFLLLGRDQGPQHRRD